MQWNSEANPGKWLLASKIFQMPSVALLWKQEGQGFDL